MIIRYEFAFPEDNESFAYQLELDDKTYLIKNDDEDFKDLPEWTELESHQCNNCPLTTEDCSHCPVAVNIWRIVEKTRDMFSYKSAVIYVHTPERVYYKKADLQVGLFSLMGLMMAGSTCPHFDFLKPQLPFHLPFATIEETLIRAAGFHLFEEWLKNKEGSKADLSFDELKKQYSDLEFVNLGILERLRSIKQKDGNKNALVTLNIFAQLFASEFNSDFSTLTKFFRRT